MIRAPLGNVTTPGWAPRRPRDPPTNWLTFARKRRGCLDLQPTRDSRPSRPARLVRARQGTVAGRRAADYEPGSALAGVSATVRARAVVVLLAGPSTAPSASIAWVTWIRPNPL
jgi:hypothetical protein